MCQIYASLLFKNIADQSRVCRQTGNVSSGAANTIAMSRKTKLHVVCNVVEIILRQD